ERRDDAHARDRHRGADRRRVDLHRRRRRVRARSARLAVARGGPARRGGARRRRVSAVANRRASLSFADSAGAQAERAVPRGLMAFWLRSEERRIAARGRRVRADVAALDDARRRFASGIRRELARPKVLLALFAAGLGFGFARRGAARAATRSPEAGVPDSERTGRLAKLVAAVLAGVR